MRFLIDYENVNFKGLIGTEYLQESDEVIIFYSDKSDTIENYRMQQIIDSGCKLEIVKLKTTRKNGLDFYIATKVGEIFAQDPEANIGIVSKDTGFHAVLDYWSVRVFPENRLVLKTNISLCINCSAEKTERQNEIRRTYKKLCLEKEFEKLQEKRRIEERLKEAFIGTAYEEMIPEILHIISGSNCPKILYLNSLKSFGRKNGLILYNHLKSNHIGAGLEDRLCS